MKDIIWNLFKKTGNIKYYLLIKKLEGDVSADDEIRGNSNRGNKLQ